MAPTYDLCSTEHVRACPLLPLGLTRVFDWPIEEVATDGHYLKAHEG